MIENFFLQKINISARVEDPALCLIYVKGIAVYILDVTDRLRFWSSLARGDE